MCSFFVHQAPKEAPLQTQIANSLMWAEKELLVDCDEAFIPSLAERVSFAALQPVSGNFPRTCWFLDTAPESLVPQFYCLGIDNSCWSTFWLYLFLFISSRTIRLMVFIQSLLRFDFQGSLCLYGVNISIINTISISAYLLYMVSQPLFAEVSDPSSCFSAVLRFLAFFVFLATVPWYPQICFSSSEFWFGLLCTCFL